jgi:primosomal protein N' (replication factor Y)
MILQIAIDTPLRQVFDYLPPANWAQELPLPGVRVLVPFGRQRLIGILVGIVAESAVPAAKLKSALAFLDESPVYDPVTF